MAQLEDILKDGSYRELVDVVASGAIAFIGAGSSARLGYPGWGDLLQKLADEAEKARPGHPQLAALLKSKDGLLRAESYRAILGKERFARFIELTYGRRTPQCDQFHRDIIEAPFSNLLTTNYDLVLEAAAADVCQSICSFDFDDEASRARFLRNCRKPVRHIAHLHGSVRNPANLILSLSDYRKVYVEETALRKVVDIALAPSQVVFIGFSLTDEYFMCLLDALGALLGAGDPRHFALLPSPQDCDEPIQRLNLTRYLIAPIFYDPSQDHTALAELIAALRRDANRKKAERELQLVREKLILLFSPSDEPISRGKALERLAAMQGFPEPPRGLAGQPGEEGEAVYRTMIDEEIDAAYTHVGNGKPEITIALLQDMLHRRAAALDSRLRYRIYANIGTAHYASERPELAANAYLEAARFRPEHKEARAFQALAYQLNQDSEHAYELSVALCRDYPDYARAHSIRIRCAPEGYSFAEAHRSVPKSVRRDVEVAGALSGLAMEEGRLRVSEVYARVAAQSPPAWSEAMMNLAAIVLIREKETALIDCRRGLIPNSPERIAEARKLLTDALAGIITRPGKRLKSLCLYNRSSANRMLGDQEAAGQDLQEAFRLQPNHPDIAASMAFELESEGKTSEAITILERAAGSALDPKTSFVLGFLLYQRKEPGDLDRAVALLRPWVAELTQVTDSRLRSDMVAVCGKSLAENGQRDAACELLEQVRGLHECMRRAILAELIFNKGDDVSRERARGLIHDAHAEAAQLNDLFALREVADCAERIGEHSVAFELRRQFTPSRVWSYDASTLLRAARNAGEDAFILYFCRALHQSGVQEREAFAVEADTLLRCHEFPRTIGLMQEWLRLHPDDWRVRLNLCLVGIRTDRPDIVVSDPSLLPTVAQLESGEEGSAVVSILAHCFNGVESGQYAYDLWRRFPNDMNAQHALISAVIGRPAATLPAEAEVGLDSAVTIRESASGETRTFVVETVNPNAQLREFPPSHAVIAQLMGSREGDEIVVEGRPATVTGVESKIAFRARQCLGDFDEMFPNNPMVRRYNVPPDLDKAPDVRTALGGVWELLEAQERHRQSLETVYGSASLPVATLAGALKRSVLETMCHLAQEKDITVWVSAGTDDEWDQAVGALKKGSVVLDATAVSTIFLLDLHDKLKRCPLKCVVPEALLLDIRNLLRGRRTMRPSGYVASVGGQLAFTEASPEQEAMWIRKLESLLYALETTCEVVGGQARLSLAAGHRESLIRNLGFGTTDAIAIARERGVPLWTDDFTISSRICLKLKIPRVWTQPVLESARGVLGEDVDEAIRKMFFWSYDFTRLAPPLVVDIFRSTRWNTAHNDSRQVLAYLRRVGACTGKNAAISQWLLVLLWSSCRNRKKGSALVLAVLDAIGRNAAARAIARPLYRLNLPGKLRDAFGVQNPHFRSLRRLLRRWRSCPASPKRRGRSGRR